MATGEKTVNGITYYGIVTYEEINEGAGREIFTDTSNRCLSKEIADRYSNYFKYKDDGDNNKGKLLKYDNIIFFSTIPIVIYVNNNSYNVYLSSCNITFAESINGTSVNTVFPTSPVTIDAGTSKEFKIDNNRGLMPEPALAPASGDVTLTITITGRTLNALFNGVANVTVTCNFWYYVNGVNSSKVTPIINVKSNAEGAFTYIYTFTLSWIKPNTGTPEIKNNELNTVWPNNADKIRIQINAGT